MGQRSKILDLPTDVRQELENRLVSGGFKDYRQLAEWLQDQDFEISYSSIHRYGQAFEERVAALKMATDQARAIADSVPDDEGAMSDALTRLAQEKCFQVLLKMDASKSKAGIPGIARSVALLNKSGIDVKRYRQEVRERAREIAESVASQAKKKGLDDASIQEIRRGILGIPG